MSVESRVESVLSDKIPNVKECSCELLSDSFLRVSVVSNVFKGKDKLNGRHEYVENILNKAKLNEELSSYSIQIVAWTCNEDRRRKKIALELQPGYKPPKRKSKSSKGSASSKKKRSSTTSPLATKSNVKSRTKADDEFIDDDDASACSWNSDEESVPDEEQEDNTESDNEFDKMMLESDDDASADDINLDSDAEDADEITFNHCVCGKVHGIPFWLQCDRCDAWYHAAEGCVGFDEDQANDEKWCCQECKPVVKVPKSIMADLQPQVRNC